MDHPMDGIFELFARVQHDIHTALSSTHSSSSRPPPHERLSRLKQINDHVFEVGKPDEGPPSVEMVFFHGLHNEGSLDEAHYTTWLSRDKSQLWLDWILEEFPQARILTVSYDASLSRTYTQGNMDMYITAENLLQDLTEGNARVGQQGCPVVLVGHSIGGVVMKELCLQANSRVSFFSSQPAQNFLQNVVGFFYFSTPHHGTRLADGRATGSLLVESLSTLHLQAARSNENFRRLRFKYSWKATGVAEGRKTTLRTFKDFIVPEASARDGMDDFYTDASADHFDVCRMESTHSSAFQKLCDLVKGFLDEKEDTSCQGDLAFPFDYSHSGNLDHLTLYRPGTGTIWILKGEENGFTSVYDEGHKDYLGSGQGIGGYDLLSSTDMAFAFDYDHSGEMDHIALYRPGTGTIWILKNKGGIFTSVYKGQRKGIGGYNLLSLADRILPYDYDHSGKMDHLVLYRPGTGTIWILKHRYSGTFAPVYKQGDPGQGIAGYDLRSAADKAFAFDYDHSGKMDHIVLYRPRTGTMWILKNSNGRFFPVYREGDPGQGIGGYDLRSSADRAFAFDYDHSGKMDYIVLYRPGTGMMWILKNNNGRFFPVYHEGDPGQGIGGYDLKSPADRAFAFDYDHSGKIDHIVLYRPCTGTMWILKNSNGRFFPVYREGDPGQGIGGYDLRSPADRAFAFDYDHSGKMDYIALYRPGTGAIWILKNNNGVFFPLYHEGDPGQGIAGYDLRSAADRAFAFDYDHSGKMDYIALYRPGTGTIWILKNKGGIFTSVYEAQRKGIGGYDLLYPADRIFTYDYDHSGKMDHIALYRPGAGAIFILKNSNSFSPVYREGDPGYGIGGYDLKSKEDRIFTYDYDHSGMMDHLVIYRPGAGKMCILKNNEGTFSPVYDRDYHHSPGIGGYLLQSLADRAFAFDYDHSGKMDYIVTYRPGSGTIWIIKNSNDEFSPVYKGGNPPFSIGSCDLSSSLDMVFPFDPRGSGMNDHLCVFRPGIGTVWILKHEKGRFSTVRCWVWQA
ncbi:unnamed protein product [Calypogeia fissa]